MAEVIKMPRLSDTMTEGVIAAWHVKVGDTVGSGDLLAEVETDKATTDVESPYSGTLVEWTVETGTVLEIGAEIGKMEVAEGVKEMPAGHGPADEVSEPEPAAVASDSGGSMDSGGKKAVRSGKIQIPPKTRKYLKEKGLDAASCS